MSAPIRSTKHTKAKKNLIRRPFRLRWILGILILGAVVSWVAGWWQFDIAQPDSSGVVVTINAPETVASGEYITIQIVVENNERVALTDADLTLQWPDSLKVLESSVEARSIAMRSWSLDEIAVGDRVAIEISAQAFGELGDVQDIEATLVYELDNFSSDFFTEATAQFEIGTKIVEVTFDDVADVAPLTETVWRVVIKNVDDSDLPVSWIRVILPEGLEQVTTDPEYDLVDHEEKRALIIPVSDMTPDEQRLIKITAQYSAGSQGRTDFVWQYGVDTDQEPRIVQEGSYEQYVIGDEAEIRVLLNGEESPAELSWGDTLNVTLEMRNITSEDLENIEWSVALPGDAIIWQGITSDLQVKADASGAINFMPADNEVLQLVPAGDTLSISFTVPLASSGAIDALQGTARLRVQGDGSGDALSFSKSFGPVPIRQVAAWHTSAHYFSDEGIQVGSGPLPPQVDERTTYRVQWNIAALGGSVESVSIKTTLPPDVAWENQFSSNQGSVTYLASSRQVVWSMNSVSAYDFSLGELEIFWQLGIRPGQVDLGDTMTLTGTTQLEVTTTDGETMRFTNPALTTTLEGDAFAQGKSIVVER